MTEEIYELTPKGVIYSVVNDVELAEKIMVELELTAWRTLKDTNSIPAIVFKDKGGSFESVKRVDD